MHLKTRIGMPEKGSISDLLCKMYLLRERYIEGVTVWQQMFAGALTSADSFKVVADTYGAMIRDLHLLRPLKIPSELKDILFDMMKEAKDEMEQEERVAEARSSGDQVFAAGKIRSTQEMADMVEEMTSLENPLMVSEN